MCSDPQKTEKQDMLGKDWHASDILELQSRFIVPRSSLGLFWQPLLFHQLLKVDYILQVWDKPAEDTKNIKEMQH